MDGWQERKICARFRPRKKQESALAVIKKSGMPLSKAPTYKDFLVASTIMKSIKRGSVDDLEKLAAMIGETVKDEQRENGMLADLIDGLKDEE